MKYIQIGAYVIIFFWLFSCDVQIEFLSDYTHPERIITGPGRFEPMAQSPRLLNTVSSGGDTIRHVYYDFIVWGEYAHPDTRDNRVIFDEHLCAHLPGDGLDTIDLLMVNYYAACTITNNDTLAKLPREFDLHTTVFDRLRSYRILKGRLDKVEEVFNYQQHAQIVEWDYKLYCLPDKPSDF